MDESFAVILALAIIIVLVIFIGPAFILPLIVYGICCIPNIKLWIKFVVLILVTALYIANCFFELEGWWGMVQYSALPLTISVIFFSNGKKPKIPFTNLDATPISSIKLVNACFICQYFLLLEFLQRILNEGGHTSIYYNFIHPVTYCSPWGYRGFLYEAYPHNSIMILLPIFVTIACIVWMHIQLKRKMNIPSSSKKFIRPFVVDFVIIFGLYLLILIPTQIWNYYPINYRLILTNTTNTTNTYGDSYYYDYSNSSGHIENTLPEIEIDYLLTNTNVVLYPENKKTIGNVYFFGNKNEIDSEIGSLIYELGGRTSGGSFPELFNKNIKEFQCGFSNDGMNIISIIFNNSRNYNNYNANDTINEQFMDEWTGVISSLDKKYDRLPLQGFGALYWTDNDKLIRLRLNGEQSLSYISFSALINQKREYINQRTEAENQRVLEERLQREQARRDSIYNANRQRELDSIQQHKIETSKTVL